MIRLPMVCRPRAPLLRATSEYGRTELARARHAPPHLHLETPAGPSSRGNLPHPPLPDLKLQLPHRQLWNPENPVKLRNGCLRIITRKDVNALTRGSVARHLHTYRLLPTILRDRFATLGYMRKFDVPVQFCLAHLTRM